MTLTLRGFIMQDRELPGFAPNGIALSTEGSGLVIHVVYSRRQARDLMVQYGPSSADEEAGPFLLELVQRINGSALPETAEAVPIRIDGILAYELANALGLRGRVPDDFKTPLGVLLLTGPRAIAPESPYVLIAVNKADGNVSIYLVPSLVHFDAVTIKHNDVIQDGYAKAVRPILSNAGLPETTELRAMHIDGFASMKFGAGLNIKHYKEATSKAAPAHAVKRMIFLEVPSPDLAVPAKVRLSAALFLYGADGLSLAIFHSKRQGVSLIKGAKDTASEDRAIRHLNVSSLPDDSQKKVLIVTNHEARTLYDAFECHSHTGMSDVEQANHLSGAVELIDPFLSKAGQVPAFAVLGVRTSASEQIVYLCKSKQQMHDLFKKHAALIRPDRRAALKRSVDKSSLPAKTEEAMVTIDGSIAFSFFRGLRILWLRRQAN